MDRIQSNINKGGTIGYNAIVDSNTLIMKDVFPSTIVAGAPGRIVKERVTWSRKRICRINLNDFINERTN